MMRVITLDNKKLEEHAERLAAIVAADGLCFDAIVGVKRGGAVVCDAFCRHFPAEKYGLRADVSKQRSFTKRKGGKVSVVLKRLPYWMLDMMRMVESKVLALRHRFSGGSVSAMEIPEDLMQVLETRHKPRILVVDDAIDSGDTLYAVIQTLKEVKPSADVRVVVVTVTTKSPRVMADYYIYNNRTLVRFPWSNDYKKR
ncbi:MAG: phosphoribosyltransferase domain-containing protein [Muribaculum sp.]|nr:phosphoribosyltransferase domain-containing protein [Muribaculum sp.]